MEHRPTPFLERVSSTRAGDWWLRGFAAVSWAVLLGCLFLLPGAWSRARGYRQDASCSRTAGQPPVTGACTLVAATVTREVRNPRGGRSSSNGWQVHYTLSDGRPREASIPDKFQTALRDRKNLLFVRMYQGEPVQYVTGDVVSAWGKGPEWDLFEVELPFWSGLVFAGVFTIPVVYRLRRPRSAELR